MKQHTIVSNIYIHLVGMIIIYIVLSIDPLIYIIYNLYIYCSSVNERMNVSHKMLEVWPLFRFLMPTGQHDGIPVSKYKHLNTIL